MRILIIGEFSSFSKNLSAGFRALGHTCFVFSWGDGFKKIPIEGDGYQIEVPTERKLLYPFRGFMYRVECYFTFLRLRHVVNQMRKKGQWDVVLIINPKVIKQKFWLPFFTQEMVTNLVKRNDSIYLSACGGDTPYYDYWSGRRWKNEYLVNLNKDRYLSRRGIDHFNKCACFIHQVIPVMFDYAEAWRNSLYSKAFSILPTIPLPVDVNQFTPHNEIKGKIVVFHGIIRPEVKGTPYIIKAMNRLQEKYPDRVECVAKGGLPLNEYLELLKRANILIDQVYAGSSGMNALYALAQGKVLLGGNEPENSIEYKYPNIPIINIGPDTDQIFTELEKLILNPSEIFRLSKEGREYVETVHDNRLVAEKYISVFDKSNNR